MSARARARPLPIAPSTPSWLVRLRFALLVWLGASVHPSLQANEVRVAVAANFAAAFQPIAAGFESATGHRVVVSAGSTGKFHAQIRHGAPFDLLIAADQETPARLIQEGLAVRGSSFTYAVGRLVLWSAQPGLIDAQGQVLRQGAFRHLAVANPKLAPYGAAAMEVISRLGLGPRLAPRIVQGESIAQTHQFVATGNAELGFVAWSQVAVPGRPPVGSWWLVPERLHRPIRQDAVLLQPGADSAAAQALLRHLRSEPARAIIRDWGYGL